MGHSCSVIGSLLRVVPWLDTHTVPSGRPVRKELGGRTDSESVHFVEKVFISRRFY